MSFFAPQNPGIGGLDELTHAEEQFLTTFASLTYNEGDVLSIVGGSPQWTVGGGSGSIEDVFGISVDGSGTVLTTGSKGFRYIEQDCTITGWSVVSDQTGSIVFDVKRSGVSLAGTEKPTLSTQSVNSDLALSTWTTSLVAGDIIEFIIDSASTVTRATLTILVTK